jgi:prepilin-type N-terminal cleavage/methylation domain-containing protein
MTGKSVYSRDRLRLAGARGFSLLEMLVAMAVFLIVSSAAFTLFDNQQKVLYQQQGVGGLNIGLRNALTQIQMDAANAGYGMLSGAYAPAWPVGVDIKNQNPATACNNPATFQYGPTCFDTLVIILADRNTPTCTLAANLNTSTATTATITPTNGLAASTYYKNFTAGSELMVVSGSLTPYFTTITLTSAATLSGSNIAISFTSTSAPVLPSPPGDPGGINPMDSPCPPTGTGYCITTDALAAYRGVSFNANTDWVIRLAPVTYTVSTANPNDPQLTRQVFGSTPVEVMDQVVAFKVGAALVNDNSGNYYYNASDASANHQYGGYGNDFTLVRSIRVSLMARTPPNSALGYKNQFDQGPYQVLGASVVVNPRNLSMNDY